MHELIANEALSHWGIRHFSLKLIAQRENAVYKVDDQATGQSWALRLHRSGLRSKSELVAESQWLEALNAGGLHVPVPIATSEGAWCTKAGRHWVDLQGWLPGHTICLDARPYHYVQLGRAMAKLHAVSDSWPAPPDFQRPYWHCGGLVGDNPVWGRFWDNPVLDIQQKTLLQNFRKAAQSVLAKQHTLDFGLIHADLVCENVLVDDNRLYLIDFDDGGFGYRLFDLATVILRLQRKPGHESLSDALIDGYVSLRKLDVELLDLFLALRACTYIGWIVPRLDEPGGAERSTRFIENGCRYVERWLNSCR